MLYLPAQAKLRTFTARLEEGICLYHEGGGIYNVIEDDRIVSTKQVNANECFFPGLRSVEPHTDEVAEAGIADAEDLMPIDSSEIVDSDTTGDSVVTSTEKDALTYTPAQPSCHGESEKSDEELHYTVAVDDQARDTRQGAERYSLRGLPRIDYSAAAKRSSFDPYNPKLSATITYKDRGKWLK